MSELLLIVRSRSELLQAESSGLHRKGVGAVALAAFGERRDTARTMPQSIDTLRALYEAISRSDFDGVVQCLHPEVEIHPAVGGELDFGSTYHGRDGMRQFMETAWRGFDVAVEAEQIFSAPVDRVLAIERWQLRARGGVETELQLIDIYTFRDGLIVGIDGFREKAEALEAAGLSE
jgi:ketosteroid isomerase-like protein